MQITKRLDSLTSLRFFAAAMIVFHHTISYGLFGLSEPEGTASIWGQGVSFFFVLSGFILAHVYPELKTWPEIRKFWLARFARVWPALAFSFIVAYWLLSLEWNTPIALSNLLMVNAWIPDRNYYFSYNAPSWSISTELFFYITFPLVIKNWNENWLKKIKIHLFILMFMFFISNTLQSGIFGTFDTGFSMTGLLYISPATRVFEFAFGVLLANVWRKRNGRIKWGKSNATVNEIGAILIVALSMYFFPMLGQSINLAFNEKAFSYWLSFAGSMFSFGLLIYVMAVGRGNISALLSHQTFVLLGEISFSLYLLHQIILRYYHANIIAFPHINDNLGLLVFWLVLLLASYLTWALIEMPSRKVILSYNKIRIHGTRLMQNSWRNHLNLNIRTGAAVISLCLVLSVIYSSMDHSAANYLERKHIPATADSLAYYSVRGDLTMIRRLIEAGVDLNTPTSEGGSALIDASWAGQDEVVATLLGFKANVNMASKTGLTALHAAIMQQHNSIALGLLAHGSNPNIVDSSGNTPLMNATSQNNLALVAALLASGADPNYKHSENGLTALSVALANKSTAVIAALRTAGANK